ncbi:helix-turn-helix transcriptional regulator [Actinomadura sp. NEAU-AAG7]|uniref:helix-turn-helix domain-containing protein n=1 Tax=Actinomadura sp. NEAU-AAG7 TaxID=2839640 RepID=UPI001BE4DBF0|nr:helix-turn-helix transcriptional regulator [Actinomadura sp. NEAU-AAG7]MBT2211546.1 helix-turn-helix domain-containing protein [Actinomadura sp. NEAU-AAG7]
MVTSSSSSAQAARERLGARLRELREAAKITPKVFAAQAGWKNTVVISQVEKGRRSITAAHIDLWCRIAEAPSHRQRELEAEQAAVVGMWLSYAELNLAGLKGQQDRVRGRYDKARLIRAYCTRGIPGLMQTAGYITTALTAAWMEQAVEVDDIAEAVAARLDRQAVLRLPGKRFVFLLEEDVLWHRVTTRTTHLEQLEHVLAAMRLPSVALGVIPRTARREVRGFGVWPEETFFITDETEVNVELVSGYLSLTQPAEIAMYVASFDRLRTLAVHGRSVVELVHAAMGALTSNPSPGEGAEGSTPPEPEPSRRREE